MPGGEQETRQRAYQYWEEEGRPEGRHLDHWRRAELNMNQPTTAADGKAVSASDRPSEQFSGEAGTSVRSQPGAEEAISVGDTSSEAQEPQEKDRARDLGEISSPDDVPAAISEGRSRRRQ